MPNLRTLIRTTCKVDGCDLPVQARSMCNSHYKRWYRSAPQCTKAEKPEALILAAMPGTRKEIEERTGFVPQTVLKYLKTLRDEKKAFADNTVWPYVYKAGEGQDMPATDEMRRERVNRLQRKRYRAKVGRKPKNASFAALMAPLMTNPGAQL